MGFVTHHIKDSNIIAQKIGDDYNYLIEGWDSNNNGKYYIADNGFFQPSVQLRLPRILASLFSLAVIWFVHSCINGVPYGESAMQLFSPYTSNPEISNVTSWMVILCFVIIGYFALFQRLDIFGAIPLFRVIDSFMIVSYMVLLCLSTGIYAILSLIQLIGWINALLDR